MKKTSIRIAVVVGVLAVVFIAGKFWPEKVMFWRGAEQEGGGAERKASRPTTAPVVVRDINFSVTAAGEITPAEQVSVRPEISGRIDQLAVDIGDRVKKGEALFTLDDTDLQTEKSQRQIEIEGARLQANGAELSVERVDLNFKRTEGLFERKLVSQEVFDNIKLELDSARNQHEISMNNLERARKALQIVEDKLAKTKILAPFDCTILTRPVSVGQAVSGASGVNSGTEVLTIADLSELIINAHINQADVTRMKAGQRVEIDVEAVAGLKLYGKLDRVAPQATIRNGIKGFATRIIVKNDESTGVRPGMTANLTIPLESADNVVAVPLAAVFSEQGNRFAYVQQGDKFTRVPINIGVSDYDFAEVTKGLQGGETVSLVTPAEDAGKVQQAFGAAAGKGARNADGKRAGGGSGKGGSPSPGGSSSGGGTKGAQKSGGSSGSSGERRGPPG